MFSGEIKNIPSTQGNIILSDGGKDKERNAQVSDKPLSRAEWADRCNLNRKHMKNLKNQKFISNH